MTTSDNIEGKDRKFPPLVIGDNSTTEQNASFDSYVSIGRVISQWARAENTDAWPKTVAGFKKALNKSASGMPEQNIMFPDAYTAFAIVQVMDGAPIESGGMRMKSMKDNKYNGQTFLMRLPPKAQLQESLDIVALLEGDYPIPSLYRNHFAALTNPNPPENAVFARVADYTMRGCR